MHGEHEKKQQLRKNIPKHNAQGDDQVVIEDQELKLDTHHDVDQISGEVTNLDPVNIRLEYRVIDCE